MTNEQQQVKDLMLVFQQECPDKPTIPSLEVRKLRAKLILEEALETISALNIGVYLRDEDGEFDCLQDIKDITFTEWDSPLSKIDIKDILDGCEDLKVVTEGTLLACGLCVTNPVYDGNGLICADVGDPHFNEVIRSNMSKMWTREEFEQEWPEAKGLEDIEGSWHKPGVESRYVTKTNISSPRCYIVKNKDGKFIKSPSWSPPNFNI